MLTFPILWDLSFSSFQMFVGVGIIWMLWIEKLFASKAQSVPVMVVVAVVAAGLNFYWGYSKVRRDWLEAQKQIRATESAAVEYEGEIS
jgi:hypothetical protein